MLREHEPELRVLPAQERLDAEDLAGAGGEDRLVVEDARGRRRTVERHAAGGERGAQPRLELDRVPADVGRRRRARLDAVAALGVRARGGVLGRREQSRGVLAVLGEHRDPDAGGEAGGPLAERERLAQRAQHLLADPRRVLGVVQAGQHEREGVLVHARGGVALAHAVQQPPRDRAQQAVGERAAELRVEALQAVEVDVHERRPARGGDRPARSRPTGGRARSAGS